MKTKYIFALAAAIATSLSIHAQDAGINAVREAQTSSAPVGKSKDASKVLRELVKERKWREGWDDVKKRHIIIEAADFKTADPATDGDFFIKRELAAKKAILSAKVTIIQSINQDMSAMDLVDVPGSDVNKALGAEREKLGAELAQQSVALEKLINAADLAETEALKGTTIGDRMNSALDALIKKLDTEYDANAKDAQKQASLKEARERLQVAQKKYAELQMKAEAMHAEVRERQESSVESIAKMPLYGSTVIMQTESWDKNSGKYQVAVMLCWSHELERTARAIVTGENFKIKPSANAKSVNDWLDEQSLAVMVGPRQYIDNGGNRWFLGISARPCGSDLSSSERRKNKNISEMFAQQMALFCVFADVESYKLAKSAIESRGDKKSQRDVVAESYAEKLTQEFKNKKIRGLQRLVSQDVMHPITGETIYVAVYGINSNEAAVALENEKINYATKILDNQYQTVERGRDAASADAVKASENRREDLAQGYSQQSAAIASELDRRKPEPEKKGGVNISQKEAASAQPAQPPKSTGGVFGGDKNLSDDF